MTETKDILYYSNYCKHCQKLLQIIAKNNLGNKFSFICIDKRKRDEHTNQTYIILENGTLVPMPPNLHSVPSILLPKQSFRVIVGDDIYEYIEPPKNNNVNDRTTDLEPTSFVLGTGSGGTNIVSETYTMYNMTPEELNSKGTSSRRQLYNYVPAQQNILMIQTPPDNYRPDKISNSVTIDNIQKQRNEEITNIMSTQQRIV